MNPKALPDHVINAMSPEDRKVHGIKTAEERREDNERKSEKEIQTTVEQYLIQLGYERRTPEAIFRGLPRSGWFIHLHSAKRNPILLDLLILSNNGSYLEHELKTGIGKVRPEQEALILQGASLSRSAREAIEKINRWHDSL